MGSDGLSADVLQRHAMLPGRGVVFKLCPVQFLSCSMGQFAQFFLRCHRYPSMDEILKSTSVVATGRVYICTVSEQEFCSLVVVQKKRIGKGSGAIFATSVHSGSC